MTGSPVKPSLVSRLVTMIGILAALGVIAAGALFCVLWFEHNRALELPAPTGNYAVGRAMTVWVDSSRTDPFAPAPAGKRELVIWAWYPADSTAGAKRVDYLPEAWRTALAANAGMLLTQFLSHNPRHVIAHALDAAPAAPSGTVFPVVILRSGIGALALDYTTLAEDLASHGAVVIAADAPYSTVVVPMPDGRVIGGTLPGNPVDASMPESERGRLLESLLGVWTADTKFIVDRLEQGAARSLQPSLAKRLDLTRLGVIGHSFGGATALQFCHDDARCRAGADLDGAPYGSVVREGLKQPFLFLLADHDGAWKGGPCPICDRIMAASKAVPGDHRVVTLSTAGHFSFSDQALTKSSILMAALRRFGVAGTIDGREGLAFTTQNVSKFLGATLAPPLAPGPDVTRR